MSLLKKQHDILFKFVGNCRYKLSKDKGNLEVNLNIIYSTPN